MTEKRCFNMRLTPEECNVLECRSAELGMSNRDYIRSLIAQDSSLDNQRGETDLSFFGDKRRKNRVDVMFTDAELAKVDSVSAALGVTRSAYIRSLIGKQRIRSVSVNVDKDKFTTLLHELRKQGVNLNQIAYRMNSGLKVGNSELVDTLRAHQNATNAVLVFMQEMQASLEGD